MNLRRLLWREIRFRKLNFLACLLAVAAAVGCSAGTVLLLRAFDLQTERVLEQKRQASQKAWATFQDEMRKDMLKLGFNLMIVHREHNQSDPDAQARTLSEAYAQKLAQARPKTINHVLPFLQQKWWWEERSRWITLVGTTGEVYLQNARQTPMLQTVPQGAALLGYSIHKALGLGVGGKLTLGGRQFEVRQCLSQRSFDEDERVYIPLRAAQDLLKKPGQITGILAVNCNCGDPEDLLQIRQEVEAILPDTKVTEYSTKLLARAHVRSKAAREADQDLARQAQARFDMRKSRLAYGAVLVGLVALAGALALGLLMWENVNRRRMEIGVLMALGLTAGRVQALFLAKALVVALAGAGCGYALAAGGVWWWLGGAAGLLNDAVLPALCTGGAVVLALAASFLPAQIAASVDPARILLQEGS